MLFRSALQANSSNNTIFADADGVIALDMPHFIAKRSPAVDYTKPVDGADPKTEWKGIHPFEDLPQTLNPVCGFVQNCNSSQFMVSDDGSPCRQDYPSYMTGADGYIDNRRSKMARLLLRNMKDVTFEDMQKLALDTTMYWAKTELPRYAQMFEDLKVQDPALAARVEPLLKHLLDWDCRATVDSTAATLCHAWYEIGRAHV